ncbi:hypothetical protein [Variovorax jilinensis]|uniref:hypothetical protein n=1 Tax=Variovorax jilinensis TaxID=3053513 RepID=UPI002576926A|nr:hypothetical protein [Variovorax sp. J22P168]
MSSRWTILLASCMLTFCLGAGAVLVYQWLYSRSVTTPWRELTKEELAGVDAGHARAAGSDIPLPAPSLSGKVHFVSAEGDNPQVQLGYLVHVVVPKLDPAQVPARYQAGSIDRLLEVVATTPASASASAPTPAPAPVEEVVYDGHLRIALKDENGAVIATLAGPSAILRSGQDNLVQGFALESVSPEKAKRAKTIEVGMTLTRCASCVPG